MIFINGNRDIFITLENHDSNYLIEVITNQALTSQMNQRKQRFVKVLYSFYNCLVFIKHV